MPQLQTSLATPTRPVEGVASHLTSSDARWGMSNYGQSQRAPVLQPMGRHRLISTARLEHAERERSLPPVATPAQSLETADLAGNRTMRRRIPSPRLLGRPYNRPGNDKRMVGGECGGNIGCGSSEGYGNSGGVGRQINRIQSIWAVVPKAQEELDTPESEATSQRSGVHRPQSKCRKTC
ncbi:unnamed protein product [Protopolystoma xenopodis]|uniref:Uncharacterized protein n=1 Tax=Protopolystoma xenopodis TaxID=117903 RepID=A0A448X6H0_9PLAT|nr:unnamed protein product [Protopolystoma xenopodis]